MYLGTPPLLEYFDAERKRTIRFKSKHEWMWATWLQDNGFDWEYEPLTFLGPHKRGGGRSETYTPDFGLSGNRVSIEIKTYQERHIKNRLDFCTQPLILICGLPSPLKSDIYVYLPGVKTAPRITDFATAYALAHNGLPSWLTSGTL